MRSPIFIFSMPRSGSTLLQKILTTHPEICSHAEPWILLPISCLHDYRNIQSEFGFKSAQIAINDLIKSLPKGDAEYYKILRNFSDSFYSSLKDSECKYFLDKTPRYFYIIDFIKVLYPDAKFIFLIRDLKDVVSSYITYFNHNSIKRFDVYDGDLFNGPSLIYGAINTYKNSSLIVRYEKLLNETEVELSRIMEYIGLDKSGINIEKAFNNTKHSIMGDGNILKTKAILPYKENWSKNLSSFQRRSILKNTILKLNDNVVLLFNNTSKDKELRILSVHRVHFSFIEMFQYLEILLARFVKKMAERVINFKDYN